MLTKIPLLTVIIFSLTYPMCFWLSFRDPLKKGFHHFHIGLPAVTAGLSLLGMKLMAFPNAILVPALIWVVSIFTVSFIYWKRETVNPYAIIPLCFLGSYAYVLSHIFLLGETGSLEILMTLLAGLILSVAFYAMNLGHWYLNVHGLPLDHLKRANLALTSLLSIRLCADVIICMRSSVLWRGEMVSMVSFLKHFDGFFLLIAFFFGTLFPFAAMYFVIETVKVRSTQSATGILYVLLSAILIGDITYKYYLLNYQLPL